jgi:hypothetical protein
MMSYPRSLLMFYSLRHIAPESKFAHVLHLDIFEHIMSIATKKSPNVPVLATWIIRSN